MEPAALRPGPRRSRPRTTFQRAVYPVLGGILFFALLALATWGIAAMLSGDPENVSERLAVTTYEVGNTSSIAAVIEDSGPLLFPDLGDADAPRAVVLDHTGDDDRRGWRAYYAYPADRDVDCKVTQIRGTRDFTDCDGRTLPVEALMPPAGVQVFVGETVILDLRNATGATTPGTGSAPATSEGS